MHLCASCRFRTEKRRKLTTKRKKSWSIRKETENIPGAVVSVDQLQSSRPVFVPQLLDKLTSTCSWAAQVMADRFSDVSYVHIMRRTSQEETFSEKSAFEIWSATFIVKIKGYHSYNEIFSEQPFRSVIEDSIQTISFCRVWSYHQNDIVEWKILNITLWSIKFLPYKNRYWPKEKITTMSQYLVNYDEGNM